MPCWLSRHMSNEQNKDSLLVDQKDALGFYFDALLLPEEMDAEGEPDSTSNEATQAEPIPGTVDPQSQAESSEPAEAVDKLQADKDFLEASKLRQGIIEENQPTSSKPKTPPVSKPVPKVKAEPRAVLAPEPEVAKGVKPVYTDKKIITKGPVSPKPREKEVQPVVVPAAPTVKPKNINKLPKTNISFSSKNNEGKVSEQTLIPRSQRLAAAKKSNPNSAAGKTIPPVDPHKEKIEPSAISQDNTNRSQQEQSPQLIKSPQPTKSPQTTNNSSHEPQKVEPLAPQAEQQKQEKTSETQATFPKEAPNLELSLFLPKIKTLSEEEIAQQIEALTQAAVSQAQKESNLAHVAELEEVSQKIKETQTEADKSAQSLNNAPSWAVPDFQALLFSVEGLKLAVPLTELNGVLEWGDEYISELPGHKSWYLGLIQNQGKSIPVIDTMQQVVPKNRWPVNYLQERKFKHIILIGNSRWGLACETVLEVVTLKTESVKWRSNRTKRRWLMGTVIDHMCALIDSIEFASMLKTGEDSLLK